MGTPLFSLTDPLPSGPWTFYFHAPKEKKWTLDTFHPIAKITTLQEALSLFQELGEKLKRGMYFCMRDPVPPLWENYQNIRGGSYSVRGGPEDGPEYFKTYVLGAMLQQVVKNPADTIVGVSVSPKIMNGQNGTSKIGFYVIKVWNKDCEAFSSADGLQLLHTKLQQADVLYTPHVDKKM
jgi:Eukaryotic initiation factor 4E